MKKCWNLDEDLKKLLLNFYKSFLLHHKIVLMRIIVNVMIISTILNMHLFLYWLEKEEKLTL